MHKTHLDRDIHGFHAWAHNNMPTRLLRFRGFLTFAQPHRPEVTPAQLADPFQVLLGFDWPLVISRGLGCAGHGLQVMVPGEMATMATGAGSHARAPQDGSSDEKSGL